MEQDKELNKILKIIELATSNLDYALIELLKTQSNENSLKIIEVIAQHFEGLVRDLKSINNKERGEVDYVR